MKKILLLQNKVAVITGASSGLGLATAMALAAEGAKLILVARREDRLLELQNRLVQEGSEILSVTADVCDEQEISAMVEAARQKFGHIDILVNNAGVMLNAPVLRARTSDWKRMLDTNVFGLMSATHAVLPLMKAQGGGHIVNISSAAARSMAPTAAVYAATKAAVNAFSEALRKEVAPHNIRITVISPGAAASELRDHIPDQDTRAASTQYAEALRILQPEDVAHAIRYAVTQPSHVGINELVLRSVDQIP